MHCPTNPNVCRDACVFSRLKTFWQTEVVNNSHGKGIHQTFCYILGAVTTTVQPKNNARARTSFCVRKPVTSCGFLWVACAWILRDAV